MPNEPAPVGGAAAEQTKQVAATATDQAKTVASDAAQQASEVTHAAKQQATTLLHQAKQDVHAQADAQTGRIAESLRQLAGQVQALVDGRSTEAGQLPDLARQATDQLQSVASRFEERGIDGVVQDAQRFARRRPGLFLAGAAALGFVGGRMLRGMQAADGSSSSTSSTSSMSSTRTTPSMTPSAPLTGATADAGGVVLLSDEERTDIPSPISVGTGRTR